MMHRFAGKFCPRLPRHPAATAGALLCAVLVTGLGIAFTNAEGLVAKSFTTALAGSGDVRTAAAGSEPLIAGSEDYWLAAPRQDAATSGRIEPAAWSAPGALGIAIGDRITISSGGRQRTLEVVDVAEVAASVTRLETEAAPGRRILVTCRDTSGAKGDLVRFVTHAPPAATASAKPPRAL